MAEEKVNKESELTQELITKSEDEFEKKITYIAAGALLLSMTLIEKVIQIENSTGKIFLILSWVCLISTLVINLVSHLVSKIHLRKVLQEITDNVDYETRLRNHRKRVFKIEIINWASALLLIIGIGFILFFASHNALQQSKDKNHTTQTGDTLNIRIINSRTIENEIKTENQIQQARTTE